jgi:hypothetical protein
LAYFPDLSEYTYGQSFFSRPGTKNVGWLAKGYPFETMTVDNAVLELVWSYCTIATAQTRGFHECEFCPLNTSNFVQNNERNLLLGTAEIRVFPIEGNIIYAAPNLIYHYMKVHKYKPPQEFIEALKTGPQPLSAKYVERLATLNLEWTKTSAPEHKPVRFRFEKIDGKIVKRQLEQD